MNIIPHCIGFWFNFCVAAVLHWNANIVKPQPKALTVLKKGEKKLFPGRIIIALFIVSYWFSSVVAMGHEAQASREMKCTNIKLNDNLYIYDIYIYKLFFITISSI